MLLGEREGERERERGIVSHFISHVAWHRNRTEGEREERGGRLLLIILDSL